MNFTISPAEIGDVKAMYLISQKAHTSSYYDSLIPDSGRIEYDKRYSHTAENEARYINRMARRLVDPSWDTYIAKDDRGVVIGFTIRYKETKSNVHLKGLFVQPSWHGRGVGTSLFEVSIKDLITGTTIELVVISNNEKAKAIYLKHHFEIVGFEDKLFFGAKQLLMRRTVN